MNYHEQSAELLVVGSSPEIYRFNFDQGTFMKPIQTITETEAINVIKFINLKAN